MIRHPLAIVMLCLMTTACATSWAKNQEVKEAIDKYNCQKETKSKQPDYNGCLLAKGDARLTVLSPDSEEKAKASDRDTCQTDTKGKPPSVYSDCIKAKGEARSTALTKMSDQEKQAFYIEGEKQAFYVDRFDCWAQAKDRSQRYFEACMRAKGYEKRRSTFESEGRLVPYSTPQDHQ